MTISITIDNLDAKIVERLRAEARRRGLDIHAVAKELLQEGLGTLHVIPSEQPHHDLDPLAGTWSAEEAGAFQDAVADLGRVDSP